jgi:hypothetical protein
LYVDFSTLKFSVLKCKTFSISNWQQNISILTVITS